jgi:hypothetical protein
MQSGIAAFVEKTSKRLTAIFMPDCFVTLLISECKDK